SRTQSAGPEPLCRRYTHTCSLRPLLEQPKAERSDSRTAPLRPDSFRNRRGESRNSPASQPPSSGPTTPRRSRRLNPECRWVDAGRAALRGGAAAGQPGTAHEGVTTVKPRIGGPIESVPSSSPRQVCVAACSNQPAAVDGPAAHDRSCLRGGFPDLEDETRTEPSAGAGMAGGEMVL